MRLKRSAIGQVLKLLIEACGDRKWQQRLEPVAELVQTILSQNTSDTNSQRAFKSLLDTFGGWGKIAEANVSEIAESIRTGGLADVKAKYIKEALKTLQKDIPDFNLLFLRDMEVSYARAWLVQLPGVGMKTASCVLLFSLGMPAFPVDTHVYRMIKRLGIINNKTSVDSAHLDLERLVKPEDVYRCHVLLIEHGRKTCKAQRPLCRQCILAKICPSYKIYSM